MQGTSGDATVSVDLHVVAKDHIVTFECDAFQDPISWRAAPPSPRTDIAESRLGCRQPAPDAGRLFEKKMRLEVPLFQRQYVWNREEQWEPLWEDIQRKFVEYLEGRKDAPVHFLGAMVLDQKQTPSTHVEKRQVIDGQQRLTTLQIFLAALRDFCREQKCEDLAKELEGYTLNKGMMANAEVERFKVWPTQLDRGQFQDVIGLGSRAAIEEKHPLVRRKRARKPDPRPRMVEAHMLFSDRIRELIVSVIGRRHIDDSEVTG